MEKIFLLFLLENTILPYWRSGHIPSKRVCHQLMWN